MTSLPKTNPLAVAALKEFHKRAPPKDPRRQNLDPIGQQPINPTRSVV